MIVYLSHQSLLFAHKKWAIIVYIIDMFVADIEHKRATSGATATLIFRDSFKCPAPHWLLPLWKMKYWSVKYLRSDVNPYNHNMFSKQVVSFLRSDLKSHSGCSPEPYKGLRLTEACHHALLKRFLRLWQKSYCKQITGCVNENER